MLSPKAARYLERLGEPMKGRITAALKRLENAPPQGDIKAMAGKDGFRLRVGGYRILFGMKADMIIVTDIGLRGQIYKGR
ncbi:MAG: type II toxin-antitoxin system RelE/ParE family toxin [Defluviitaleaceae bacterium]|nr:type II toxin-antitoxin system RelE/ParE family toxin [Defluviitaleaceae bacterium]